jgi:hypothetical protein
MRHDSKGNPIRYYEVTYTRNLAGGGTITPTVITSEFQLKSMLCSFDGRYNYIVHNAEYLPDYEPEED